MKKLKCKNCNDAEEGENLWYIDGEFYCVYCALSHIYNCGYGILEPVGYVGEDRAEALKSLGVENE